MDVLLFRTPSESDPYDAAFAEAGYKPRSVQALDDELLPDGLVPILAAGGGRWEAVLITSRRAAEAWCRAVVSAQRHPSEDFKPWSDVPFYAPGGAVASVFDAHSLEADWRPKEGGTAVNAANLAPIILNAPPRHEGYGPYLVLIGDKTLPLLSNALSGAGRRLNRVQVYETTCAVSLPSSLGEVHEGWVAFFSPSSAVCVLPLLEGKAQLPWDASVVAKPRGTGPRIKIAAIGRTTEGYLREQGLRVEAVAETPDPEGLLAAIKAADARQL